jgi:macrolide-specific efflux system membrane fusion protein
VAASSVAYERPPALSRIAHFTVPGQTRRWSGTIRQVLPTPALINNVVFYNILFDIPNPGRELNIQMTAQVFIVLAQAKNALLIPTAVIGNASEGATIKVQVPKADGRVEPRAIAIGIKSGLSAGVTSGLEEKGQ